MSVESLAKARLHLLDGQTLAHPTPAALTVAVPASA